MRYFKIFLLTLIIVSCDNRNKDGQLDKVDPYVISNGQALNIKTGENFDSVLLKLKDYTIEKDSFSTCEGCDDFYPIYRIREKGNSEPVLSIEQGFEDAHPDRLFRIRTSDPRFKTDKGLQINMKVTDLKRLYEIEDIVADYETGLHILVKGFQGAFGVEPPLNTDWTKYNKDNIPDTLFINEIVTL